MRRRLGWLRALSFGWFLTWSLASSPAGAETSAGSPECRRADRLSLNLTAWKAALKRAATDDRRDELLAAMRLKLERDDPDESSDRDGHKSTPARIALLGLDDMLAHLSQGDLPDHVIQVRYRIETPDDKSTAFLIQVLRPIGDGSWCFVGNDLSWQDDDESHVESYTLAFVPLLSARTKAVEIRTVVSQLRHSEMTRQYWIVEGLALRKLFDQKIDSMDNVEDGRDASVTSGKLALAGGFPKRIELTQTTKHSACDVHSGDAPCDDKQQASKITFVYDGKTYVRRR